MVFRKHHSRRFFESKTDPTEDNMGISNSEGIYVWESICASGTDFRNDEMIEEISYSMSGEGNTDNSDNDSFCISTEPSER